MREYPVKKIVISIGLGLLALWAMQLVNNSDFSFNPSSQSTQVDSAASDEPGEQARAKGFRNENDWMGAYKAVQQEVRNRIENGDELTFPWDSNTHVQREGKSQSYQVESYALMARSKTDTVQIHFRAKVQQEEDDRWLVYELQLSDSTEV